MIDPASSLPPPPPPYVPNKQELEAIKQKLSADLGINITSLTISDGKYQIDIAGGQHLAIPLIAPTISPEEIPAQLEDFLKKVIPDILVLAQIASKEGTASQSYLGALTQLTKLIIQASIEGHVSMIALSQESALGEFEKKISAAESDLEAAAYRLAGEIISGSMLMATGAGQIAAARTTTAAGDKSSLYGQAGGQIGSGLAKISQAVMEYQAAGLTKDAAVARALAELDDVARNSASDAAKAWLNMSDSARQVLVSILTSYNDAARSGANV